jgi:hypothetical protein
MEWKLQALYQVIGLLSNFELFVGGNDKDFDFGV